MKMKEEPVCDYTHTKLRKRSKLLRIASERRTTLKNSCLNPSSASIQISDSIKDLDAFKANSHEITEILEIAKNQEEKSTDVFSQIREMQQSTCKYNNLKHQSVVNWLKSRYSKVAKKEYTNTDSELLRHKEIEDMFLLFDSNRSGTLEINEISDMFKTNGISMTKANLVHMFQLVDKDNSGTLTFNEFKEFMLSETRQKLFTDLMRKERDQQIETFLDPNNHDIKSAISAKIDYLPLSADCSNMYLPPSHPWGGGEVHVEIFCIYLPNSP